MGLGRASLRARHRTRLGGLYTLSQAASYLCPERTGARQMCAITRTHKIAVTGVARSLPRESGGRRTMHLCRFRGPLLQGALEGQSWEFSPSGCSLSGGVVLSQVAVFFLFGAAAPGSCHSDASISSFVPLRTGRSAPFAVPSACCAWRGCSA